MTPQQWYVFVQAILVAESLRKSGWCAGNEYAAIQTVVERYINSIPSPVNPPLEVRRAIVLKFLGQILATLSFDGLNKCWGFMWAGMYHGVEPDGHIHT